MKPILLRGAALTGAVIAVVLFTEPGSALADDRQHEIKVGNLAESWYFVNPTTTTGAAPPALDTCSLPTGCVTVPVPVEVPLFPAGSLQISSSAVSPLSTAFVVPNLTEVPVGATVLKATMHLAITQASEAGNANFETAALVGCPTTSLVSDGAAGDPLSFLLGMPAPTYDCGKVKSKAVYDKKAQEFVLPIAKLLAGWKGGDLAPGIALVPDPDVQSTVWHVSINGNLADEKARTYSDIVYRGVPPLTTPSQGKPPAVTSPSNAGTTRVGGGLGSVPSMGVGGVDPPTDTPAASVPVTPAEPQAAPVSLLNGHWYSYPGVAFLPVAFAVAIAFAGRALTRPLARTADPRPRR